MPEGFSDKILCYFPRAAIINHDKLGGLKRMELCSYGFEG